MPPIPSQSDRSAGLQSPGLHRFVRVLLLSLLVIMVALLVELFRGQWALYRWKNEMTARGEVFEAAALWPPESDADLEFSNQMTEAVSKLPPRLRYYSSLIAGIVTNQPGQFRRGSQEPRPRLWNRDDTTN